MGIGRLGQEFNNGAVILFEALSLTHYGICGLERGIELEKTDCVICDHLRARVKWGPGLDA